MILYEERKLEPEEGARRMVDDVRGKVIDFNKYLTSKSNEIYDGFIEEVLELFTDVDEYIPLDTENLFNQLPLSIDLLYSSEDRLYKLMLKYGNKIEPFMISYTKRSKPLNNRDASLVEGLTEAIMNRFTDIGTTKNIPTDWVDKLLRESFPHLFKDILSRTGEYISREDWLKAMNSDLKLIKGQSDLVVPIAYLSMIMLCEQVLLKDNPKRREMLIVYGPEGRFYDDIIYASYGGLMMTTFESLSFKVDASDTPIKIIEKLYKLGTPYRNTYMISKYMLNSLGSLYDDNLSKDMMMPIGEERAEIFNGFGDINEAIVILFQSYSQGLLDELYGTIESMSEIIDSVNEMKELLASKEMEVDELNRELDDLQKSIQKKDSDLLRLNKLVGKYQADDLRVERLREELSELKDKLEG